jgi:hypothetical protein
MVSAVKHSPHFGSEPAQAATKVAERKAAEILCQAANAVGGHLVHRALPHCLIFILQYHYV